MAHSRHIEFAKATAVCVNLAIDGIEGDIRKELSVTSGEAADTLKRVLERLKKRRIVVDELAPIGNA